MKVLQKIYCGLIAISFFFLSLLAGSSWAEEGTWEARYFWWNEQEYAVWLRKDEPGPLKNYYISHILRDNSGDVYGEEEIYRDRAVVSEVITGEDFFGPGKGVVAFLNLQNNGYLSGFELLKFDHNTRKLNSFHRQSVTEEGHLLTSYGGNLIWWRGLQSRLVLFDRKKGVRVEECMLGIIPSPAGGFFLELERDQKGPALWFVQKFSGSGKSLKMEKRERMTKPITLKVGQSLILLRTGDCRDMEKFKVENQKVSVLEPFNPGLPTVLKATSPGTSWIVIQLEREGESPQMLDIEVVVLGDQKRPEKKTIS